MSKSNDNSAIIFQSYQTWGKTLAVYWTFKNSHLLRFSVFFFVFRGCFLSLILGNWIFSSRNGTIPHCTWQEVKEDVHHKIWGRRMCKEKNRTSKYRTSGGVLSMFFGGSKYLTFVSVFFDVDREGCWRICCLLNKAFLNFFVSGELGEPRKKTITLLNPGCLMTGSLFHGWWNNPPIAG